MDKNKSIPLAPERIVQQIWVKWSQGAGVYLEIKLTGAKKAQHCYAMIEPEVARAIAMELLEEAAFEDEKREERKAQRTSKHLLMA